VKALTDSAAVTASLKRCPDPNGAFFSSLLAHFGDALRKVLCYFRWASPAPIVRKLLFAFFIGRALGDQLRPSVLVP